MPRKSKRPCSHPGCPNLTDNRYCDQHKLLHPDRPSAAKRGYGKNPLCVKCKANGRFVTATVVDHIIPHRGDSVLMWSESNWQALCKRCHDKKTGNEDSNPVYGY